MISVCGAILGGTTLGEKGFEGSDGGWGVDGLFQEVFHPLCKERGAQSIRSRRAWETSPDLQPQPLLLLGQTLLCKQAQRWVRALGSEGEPSPYPKPLLHWVGDEHEGRAEGLDPAHSFQSMLRLHCPPSTASKSIPIMEAKQPGFCSV